MQKDLTSRKPRAYNALMNLPDDLRDYRAPLGAFQVIDPEEAIAALLCIGAWAIVFAELLK